VEALDALETVLEGGPLLTEPDEDVIVPEELSVDETDPNDGIDDERSEELDTPCVVEPNEDRVEEPGVDTTTELAEPDREVPELDAANPEVVLAVSEVDKTMLVEPETLPLPVVEVRPEED